MTPMDAIRIKICCIQSTDEAAAAIAAGADAIGLVAEMPIGPGPIGDDRIREIADFVRARHGEGVLRTLLTRRTDPQAIADHVAETGVNAVQIVAEPEPGTHVRLRRTFPDLAIIQVVHVEDETALDAALAAAETADMILLDSGRPSASAPTFGGTGRAHDWAVSRRIVEAVGRPVFLAGGLNPGNVRNAIGRVRPFGVDVCSGLRDARRGDALVDERLRAFVAAARGVGAGDPRRVDVS